MWSEEEYVDKAAFEFCEVGHFHKKTCLWGLSLGDFQTNLHSYMN